MKVLIADDSPVVIKSLTKLITTKVEIDSIIAAHNVNETLFKIIKTRPDILILDIMMPGGDGFQVMKTVREQDYKITVIMLTNFTNEYNRERSIQEGIDYFLDKSNEFNKVVGIVKELSKEIRCV